MDLLIHCLNFLNKIIPKKNYVIFNSYPDFCDNSYELYSYIIHNRQDLLKKYTFFWTRTGKTDPDTVKLHPQTSVVDKKSVKGIWLFLRARYVITTHGYFVKVKDGHLVKVKSGHGQVQVNLWHGCGYKTLTESDRGYRGDIAIVTSKAYRQIFSELFDVAEKDVFVTGYPRNDKMFHPAPALYKMGIQKEKFEKVIVWMPTYRRAATGHDGVDGSDRSFLASNLTKDECMRLNEKLQACNFCLIIKPHPMDAATLEKFDHMSNIFCLTTQQLQDKGAGLYDMLAESDVLLSDYSSVVIDYLLLDKPIAMVLSDASEYGANRGFLFQPVEEYFPGPIISTFEMLLGYLDTMDQVNTEWEKKRTEIAQYFHAYIDDKSSERVTKVIFGEEK